MNRLFILLVIAALATGPAFAQLSAGALVVNEVRTAEPGTDDEEFVELYNASGGTIDFSATPVSVEFVNGGTGTAYNTINITSGILASGDYFVIAGGTLVPNTDLVAGPSTNFIQNGDPDAIRVSNGTATGGSLIDAVAYFTQYDTVPGTPENALLPTSAFEGAGGSGAGGDDTFNVQTGTGAPTARTNTSFGRFPDGADTNDNNVDITNLFSPAGATPGASNSTGFNLALSFTEDFSQTSGLTRTWSTSFTQVSLETAATAIPAGIPNSPDSMSPSEWASLKDPAGGGEQSIIVDFLGRDYNVSAYFYCGAGTSSLASPDTEVGALMARVTGQSHQNNVSGSYDITVPIGTYGSSWYAIETDYRTGVTTAVNVLNSTRTDLGSTVIPAPGWHLFAIRCEGNLVEFAVDGSRIELLTSETPRNGYVGVGYREIDSVSTGTVRNNFDALSVTLPGPVPAELSVLGAN